MKPIWRNLIILVCLLVVAALVIVPKLARGAADGRGNWGFLLSMCSTQGPCVTGVLEDGTSFWPVFATKSECEDQAALWSNAFMIIGYTVYDIHCVPLSLAKPSPPTHPTLPR